MAKDNTVAIGDRLWQIDKTRFRSTLAGSTVTIHEHLDENGVDPVRSARGGALSTAREKS